METATSQRRADLGVQAEKLIKVYRQTLAVRLFQQRSVFEAARELCARTEGA